MNKRSIIAIEKIITDINELNILTHGKDDEYFYDSFEFNALIEIFDDIENQLSKISDNIKNKYSNIKWNIIRDSRNEYDELRVGTIWELVSHVLYEELYDKLNNILKSELPNYYRELCNRRHERLIKMNNN